MRLHRHVFRDVFLLTLPLAVFLVYLVSTSLLTFYRGEIANFHGYPVRALRVGGMHAVLDHALAPLDSVDSIATVRPRTDSTRGGAVRASTTFRVDGVLLDELRSDLPASAKDWVRGALHERGGRILDVDVRNRGQRMVNYFWDRKSWKIRVDPRELVDGYRVINLTPLESRLDVYLTFLVARAQGLPAPRSRVVQLYLNGTDQGLYVQEEQVDESMIRRHGRMPGDVFYGELFVPDEPTMSADDLFWNAYLWRKKAVHNWFGEDHRPYLFELLSQVTSPDIESFDAIWDVLDRTAFTDYFAILTLQGDQHVDHSHNHKLYFSPISGRFEPILWNPLINMPMGHGVESTANQLFRKVVRDPEFLDGVHARVREFVARDAFAMQLAEIDRIERELAGYAIHPKRFRRMLDAGRRRVSARAETVQRFSSEASIRFASRRAADAETQALDVFTRSAASLRLASLEFAGPVGAAVEVFEDRDANGQVDAADRRVEVRRRGPNVLAIATNVRLFGGRDLRASYHKTAEEGEESFASHRAFSRLAYLRSGLLVRGAGADVVGLEAASSVRDATVRGERASVEGYVATESVHPWSRPAPPPPRELVFRGRHRLDADLIVRDVDTLRIEPGTTVELGPGVSIVSHSRVTWRDVSFVRADASVPWGVIALQGAGASESSIEGCTFVGGSHDVPRFVYYSGMFSVHEAHDVTLRDCEFGQNLLGDDTVRFARCEGVRIERVTIRDANGDAIDCDQCRGRIEGVRIEQPRNDGIDLMTADVAVHGSVVRGAGDKGISFGEGASPIVTECELDGCVLGVGIKDASDPILYRVVIRDCEVAIAGYDKNWRYAGGGRGRLLDCVLENNGVDVRLDKTSDVTLVGVRRDSRLDAAAGQVLELTDAAARERAVVDDRFDALLQVGAGR